MFYSGIPGFPIVALDKMFSAVSCWWGACHQGWLCAASYAAADCWRCPCAGTSVLVFFCIETAIVGISPVYDTRWLTLIKRNLANKLWFEMHNVVVFGLKFHARLFLAVFCSIGIHGFDPMAYSGRFHNYWDGKGFCNQIRQKMISPKKHTQNKIQFSWKASFLFRSGPGGGIP